MKNAQVGVDCNLGEHVFVESGAIIGNRVTVKNGISIWDGVSIADDVFLGPHMVFTNDLRPRAFNKKKSADFSPTRIEEGASIGAGAVLVCGVSIGKYALVAAGAVVTRSVPPYAVVKGNPARHSGWICRCSQTLVNLEASSLRCDACGTTVPG